jgi:hypothetical protein
MRQVLAWDMGHDAAVALRLADALGWWWFMRGRLTGQYSLLREGRPCRAGQRWVVCRAVLARLRGAGRR